MRCRCWPPRRWGGRVVCFFSCFLFALSVSWSPTASKFLLLIGTWAVWRRAAADWSDLHVYLQTVFFSGGLFCGTLTYLSVYYTWSPRGPRRENHHNWFYFKPHYFFINCLQLILKNNVNKPSNKLLFEFIFMLNSFPDDKDFQNKCSYINIYM